MNTIPLISQNREYFQTYCNDRNSPSHYACCEWMVNQ